MASREKAIILPAQAPRYLILLFKQRGEKFYCSSKCRLRFTGMIEDQMYRVGNFFFIHVADNICTFFEIRFWFICFFHNMQHFLGAGLKAELDAEIQF